MLQTTKDPHTMNRITFIHLAFVALSAALLGACASPSSPSVPASSGTHAADGVPLVSSQARQDKLPLYQDPGNLLSQKRSVYFDFDRYTVAEAFRPTVQAHAAYLSAHPEQKIRIEGNADENGSREYNLALGQKRAAAVRNALVLLGASDAQIEAVSWGKERPKAVGHDEAAWAENRRADIKYGGEN